MDYDGILANGPDIRYVVCCEIMGFLCDEKEMFEKEPKVNTDKQKNDLDLKDLSIAITNYANLKGCKFNNWQLLRSNVIRHEWGLTLPMLHFDKIFFTPYISDSLKYDKEFRDLYGDRMLYNQPDAAFNATKNIKMTILDRGAVYRNPTWIKKIDTFIALQLKEDPDSFCKFANVTM